MEKSLNEFQETSRATAEIYTEVDAFSIFSMGTCGESWEVGEKIKKWIGHGHELNLTTMTKESGDALWYTARVADLVGLKLGDVWEGANHSPKLDTYFKHSNFTYLQHAALDTLAMMGVASAIIFLAARRIATAPGNELQLKRKIKANLIDFIGGLKALLKLYNIDVAEVVRVNNAKLRGKRYKNGFSAEASMARVDTKDTVKGVILEYIKKYKHAGDLKTTAILVRLSRVLEEV